MARRPPSRKAVTSRRACVRAPPAHAGTCPLCKRSPLDAAPLDERSVPPRHIAVACSGEIELSHVGHRWDATSASTSDAPAADTSGGAIADGSARGEEGGSSGGAAAEGTQFIEMAVIAAAAEAHTEPGGGGGGSELEGEAAEVGPRQQAEAGAAEDMPWTARLAAGEVVDILEREPP
eukprot:2997567-Prymnesium_polylepis.1